MKKATKKTSRYRNSHHTFKVDGVPFTIIVRKSRKRKEDR